MSKYYMYLVQWYGPFSSRKELKRWEDDQKESFFLYLFQGKRKNKRSFRYYCGMTYYRKNNNASVAFRIGDSNHHIHSFEKERPETISIWIGKIANLANPHQYDVRLCENMITSEMAQIEIDSINIENETNKLAPNQNTYIINEWYDHNGIEYRPKSSDYFPNRIPDVISYYAPTKSLYRAKKLVYYGNLK